MANSTSEQTLIANTQGLVQYLRIRFSSFGEGDTTCKCKQPLRYNVMVVMCSYVLLYTHVILQL